MKFIETTVTTTDEAEELVSDIMWRYTNYGVSISNVKDIVDIIENRKSTWDYIDDSVMKELNQKVTLVKAYILKETFEDTIKKIDADLEELKANCAGNINPGSLEIVKREVDGDDWIEIWRKHYKPIIFGNIVVCPAWIEYAEKESQIKIIIDSNMAFGTGEHETTSMMLSKMQNYDVSGKTVIDVGTGSGILGIAAAKLGAKEVYMTDIDAVAVKSARHNCEINGTSDKCTVDLNNLLDEKNVVGDCVLANITADVLLILSRSITPHIKMGGVMLMSGIIKSRVDEVVQKYESLGFELLDKEVRGEWVAIAMRKAR